MTDKPTFETVLPRRQFVATGAAAALGSLLGAAGLLEAAHAQPPAAAADKGLRWTNWSGLQQARPTALPTPATEAELQAAKDNLIGGFALRIDSNRKLLGNVVNIATNDLPLDYLEGWTDRVAALTVADVRAAMARKLQPERMVTVVLGAQP